MLRTLCAKESFMSETALNLKKEISSAVAIYGFSAKNLYSITTDNANNMLKCVQLLAEEADQSEINETQEEDRNEEQLMFSEEEGDMCVKGLQCAAHTLQLTVYAVTKAEPFLGLIPKVREFCKLLRSPSMFITLKTLGL